MLEIKDNSKNIEEINLKTKLLILETKNGEILVDVQALLKAPIGSEEAYFRATGIAQAYKKDIRDFLRLDGTIEYIDILKEELKVEPMIIKRGKYQGGTWLYYKLFKPFLRWVLPFKDYAKLEVSGQLEFQFSQNRVLKSVYVLKTEDNRIKVGISSNAEKRFSQIKNSTGLNLINTIYSEKVENAYLIEQTLLTYFDDYRQNGEWLNGVGFERSC
ncbi:KilA-N domain-containing protein,T5orf172 domain-containing protein [Thiovulum sp. ES]|nr:KilA-N domain-containing protein,T5orf172 domain-containing protein [Thiovulum sp. ES]